MATDPTEPLDEGFVDLDASPGDAPDAGAAMVGADEKVAEVAANAAVAAAMAEANAEAKGGKAAAVATGAKPDKKAAKQARKEALKAAKDAKAAKAKAEKAKRASQPKPPMSVYTWMLILSLLFLFIASAALVVEMRRYNFERVPGKPIISF